MVFNLRKTKRIAKFDVLEPGHCKDIKGILAPKVFGTFEKQAPGRGSLLLFLIFAGNFSRPLCQSFFLVILFVLS